MDIGTLHPFHLEFDHTVVDGKGITGLQVLGFHCCRNRMAAAEQKNARLPLHKDSEKCSCESGKQPRSSWKKYMVRK